MVRVSRLFHWSPASFTIMSDEEASDNGQSKLEVDVVSDTDQEDLTGEHDTDEESETLDLEIRKAEIREAATELEAKVRKSGVVYLSTIPPGMNVAKLREMLSQYGKIGRMFLEPDKNSKQRRSKNSVDSAKFGRRYLEGWVEFLSKKVARNVAEALNNQQVGGKRRSPYYESLWNIKYLHRFKWNHLTEQLGHEKMTQNHRLRQEMTQAKRQTNFFSQNIEKGKMLERMQKRKLKEGQDVAPLKTFEIPQKPTDEEVVNEKNASVGKKTKKLNFTKHRGSAVDKSILLRLFPKK